MIVDTRSLPAGQIIEADLCVVGSGPGGLALAREFDGRGLKVAVLETGGLNDEPATNALSNLDPGSRYGGETRIENTRRLGGNANAWSIQANGGFRNVRMTPYTRGDFQPREWMADSGWPIPFSDYEPYVRRAQGALKLPEEKGFEGADWADNSARPFGLNGSGVRTGMFQFADGQDFVDRNRAAMEASANITIYAHANALELVTDAGGSRVVAVRAASDPGHEVQVKAKRFVLACGGLGVPQLMWASTRNTPGGIGNKRDTLGRWFMDHPLVDGGELVPASKDAFEANTLYDLRTVRDTPVMGFLAPTDKALADQPIGNLNMYLFAVETDYRQNRDLSERQHLGFYSTVRIREALRNRQRPLVRDVLAAAWGADGVAKHMLDIKKHPKFNLGRGGWSELDERAQRFDQFEVLHLAEQAPNRDNRVSLGDETDRFGMRRVKIDWSWSEADTAATVRAQDLMAAEIKRAGVGEFRVLRDNGQPVLKTASTGHFLGATRMSKDPARGVVDTNCRVHDTENLYVASSSTFPTGSYANPTLSIIALAIRLADFLMQTV